MTYADYLMSHYLALNAVVVVVALLAFIWLSRKIPKGWLWGLTGFLLAIAFAVLIEPPEKAIFYSYTGSLNSRLS